MGEHRSMNRSLITVDQFDRDGLGQLFLLADKLKHGQLPLKLRSNLVSVNLFYEPSTRTSSSFYSAMVKLGGGVIPINDVSFSSVSKGETLEDTVRVMSSYSDVIVLRHPQVGSSRRAASVAGTPIINAGDGVGEHPTQALLDLYTISRHHDLNQRLRVALVGDLLHGRTVHSLLKLLRLYDVELHLVGPAELAMPAELVREGDHVHLSIDECISNMDVIYVTRVQKERFTEPHLVSTDPYRITLDVMDKARPDLTLMHPLPRVDEIDPAVDRDPRAVYFEQCENGMWIRQAVFVSLFGGGTVPWHPL